MRTVTQHNLATTKGTTVPFTCPRAQGLSYGSMMSNRPWSNEILVEGAAFARGSDPSQEALL